jgi:purine nucleosidase
MPAILFWLLASAIFTSAAISTAHAQTAPHEQQLVIIDTDIGDDIDDAFALALAERTPQFHILGITTAFGDTTLRAQLVIRFLAATGHPDIPVAAGIPTPPKTDFTQAAYARSGDKSKIQPLPGPDFLLQQLRLHPHEITAISIGPLTNLAAAFRKDPAAFRLLKRIVMMGGSIDRGYDGHDHPDPEWNILCDIPAARTVFASGVPIFDMPLDATDLKFRNPPRAAFFARDTPLTRQIQLLYSEWGTPTPTLFDPMAVAYAADPALCHTTPLNLAIDDQGYTRRTLGPANINACLHSDPSAFFRYYLGTTADLH